MVMSPQSQKYAQQAMKEMKDEQLYLENLDRAAYEQYQQRSNALK